MGGNALHHGNINTWGIYEEAKSPFKENQKQSRSKVNLFHFPLKTELTFKNDKMFQIL